MKTKFRTLSLSVATAVFLITAHGATADSRRRSFEVRAGGQLNLDSELGSIEVRAKAQDRVEIEVTTTGSGADHFSVDFDQEGNEINVRGEYEGSSLFGWLKKPRVKFIVTVPERFDVDLETAGGSISVDDLEGEVRVGTSGGSLALGNIRGPVWGGTSGGSIVLKGSTGDAELETSGGSISIGEVDGSIHADTSGGSIHISHARGEVDAETSGGSIHVDEVMGAIRANTSGGSINAYISEQPQGDCRLSTSGGRVTVYLADGITVDLDAASSGGRVSSDFEVAARRRSKEALAGKIGGGGPELYLRSSGGGVQVRRR